MASFRIKRIKMFIDLTQLERDELLFEHQYPVGSIDLQDENLTLNEPCSISLRLNRRGHDIDAQGTVATTVGVNCDRCLTPTLLPLSSSFNLIYLPFNSLSATDELVLERRELDFSFYKDNRLDIDELVQEQIRLALPMTNLCREDCRGLCGKCGQDLNNSTCQCVTEDIDPRWSALLELKNKKN
jgi:uncharacterized protein